MTDQPSPSVERPIRNDVECAVRDLQAGQVDQALLDLRRILEVTLVPHATSDSSLERRVEELLTDLRRLFELSEKKIYKDTAQVLEQLLSENRQVREEQDAAEGALRDEVAWADTQFKRAEDALIDAAEWKRLCEVAQTDAAELRQDLDKISAEREAYREVLPDPQKLEHIAGWFDLLDKWIEAMAAGYLATATPENSAMAQELLDSWGPQKHEIQNDLRTWARRILAENERKS